MMLARTSATAMPPQVCRRSIGGYADAPFQPLFAAQCSPVLLLEDGAKRRIEKTVLVAEDDEIERYNRTVGPLVFVLFLL